MPIELTVRSVALQIDEANDPGAQPELFYRLVNPTSDSWTLAKVTAMRQGSFGGQLVIETNAGGATPSDTTIERLRITQAGHVGIGTPTPGFPLDVNGIVNATDVYKNGAPLVASQWSDVTGGISFTAGNVGIGVASPTQALEVNGAVKATDFIKGSTSLVSSQWVEGAGGLSYNDGRVGIGTRTPQAKLHIEAGSVLVNGEGSGVIVDEGGRNRVGFMKYVGREAGIWRLNNQDFEIGRLDTSVTALPGTPTTFVTDLYIGNNGNIGIGTTSPSQKLDVRGYNLLTDPSAQFNSHFPFSNNSAYLTGVNIYLRGGAPQGWRTALTVTTANGNVGIGTESPGARLHVANGGAIINGVTVGADVTGSIDYPWEYETIGVAAPNFNLRLQSPNSVIFHPGGARNNVISIDPAGNIGHARGARCDGSRWIDASSLTYKSNVDPLSVEKALTTLVGLAPVIFRYKTEDDDTRHVGFIAEEVPDLVAAPDRKGVSAMDIVGILTKVVQHQQQQITELYSRLQATPPQPYQVIGTPNALPK